MQITITCPKCYGTKKIDGCEHVAAGVCFRCGGAGLVTIEAGSTEAIDEERRQRLAQEDARRLAWLRSATAADIRRMNAKQLHAAFQFAAAGVSCEQPTAENLAIYRKVKAVFEVSI